MDPVLEAALKAGWKIVHFVTVTLPGYTIRWSDAGYAKWGAHTWRARDPIYGVLDEIGEIVDGIDDDASPVQITIIPPDLSSLEALASADAQGGWVEIHLAATNPVTGLLAGEPYRLHLGELDQPRLRPGKTRKLDYDIITGEARGLQPNEEQRQSDAFRQLVWPGERGDEYATDGTKMVWWREDEPRNVIGLLTGRGGTQKQEDNKAIEFSYEPNAPLAFPFGRVGVGASVRYRVGYGPTNRFQSIFATVGASGPVKSLVKVAFDDEVTSFSGGRATNGSHAGEMWFQFLPGAQPSVALTSPTGTNAHTSAAPGWGANHKLSGRPAFCWTGKENSKKDEYRGGIPRPVLTLEGLYGYDALQDDTQPFGIGDCRVDDPSTWVWLDEGARVALNWAIGRWEGSTGGSPAAYGVPYQSFLVGGIAAPLPTIDIERFAEAAAIATSNGWKMAGVPFSDENKSDVLEDMLRASGAVRARRCGMLSCVSFGAPRSSVLTATAADTAGPPDISLAPSRLDRRNTGIPSFLSEEHRWEMTPITAVTNPDWVEQDGGRNTEGYDFRFVPDADQAAQLCYLAIANEREKIEASAPFKPWMMKLEPGDAFDWDAPEYLLTGTKVRVRKRSWDPKRCVAKIDFRQETDQKYIDAFLQTGSTPPAFEPNPPPESDGGAADQAIGRSVLYPLSSDHDSISVEAFVAFMPWGEAIEIPAGTITGLAELTDYGVFWREDVGFEVEVAPAEGHMLAGGWLLIGWQSTSDDEGGYPEQPPPPGGWCPHEDELLLLANDEHTGPGETVRAGDVQPGAWVWTRHEHTGAWGAFQVTDAASRQSDLSTLRMRDGRESRFSPKHRMGLANGRFRRLADLTEGDALDGTGPGTVETVTQGGTGIVIRLSVNDAATYVINGLLCHNAKPLNDGTL